MATRKKTEYLVIHCSATTPDQDIGRAEIDQWHRAKGWAMVGYHRIIRRDGTVEQGRPIDMIGAHVEGFNATSVGICLVGGLDAAGTPRAEYTPAQWASLTALVRELRATYPKALLRGHRDFPKVQKACPSFDVTAWWERVSGR